MRKNTKGKNTKRAISRGIWAAFLKGEAHDFAKEMGYGPKEIKAIGVRKFIAAHGWSRTDQVVSWRTDLWRIVICPGCGKDFGILNDDMGLCSKCLPLYDLNAYFAEVQRIVGEDTEKMSEALGKAIIAFMYSSELRAKYIKI